MVDLPTPRGDRPGSLMVNNGSQRSGFESRWRHFDFLIRFFFFLSTSLCLPCLPVPPSLVRNVTGNQSYRQSRLLTIKIYRQSSLPAINHFFFLQAISIPSPSDIVLQTLPSQLLQDQVEKKRDRTTQVYSYKLLYVFVAGLLFLNKQTTAYYPAGSGTHPHITLQVQQENMDSFWRIPHQASTRSSRVELFYPPPYKQSITYKGGLRVPEPYN